MDPKQRLCDLVDEMAPDLLAVSHAIHAHPELAFKEFQAAETLTRAVAAAGLPVQSGVYGLETSFETAFGNGEPCLAILAEYDALPGIGHACGHNVIATAALGAALALAKLEGLPGRVRLYGTPGEESGGGKELMAREGAFAGVDAAIMVHPAGVNAATMPAICVATVKVVYHGRAAHAAAMPHLGVNALDALVTSYQAIAQLRQHIHPTERLHGIFTETGDAANIVPARAAGKYMVRAATADRLQGLKGRVEACLEAGATATGCSMEMTWGDVDYLDMQTNWPLANCFQANAERLGRQFLPTDEGRRAGAGSTDMGNVSHIVPAMHPLIACAPREITIHNPEFTHYAGAAEGDLAALDGAKALAMTAFDYLTDESLQASVWAAFAGGTDGN